MNPIFQTDLQDSTRLREIAREFGIQPSYELSGRHVEVSEAALRGILASVVRSESDTSGFLPVEITGSVQPEAPVHHFKIQLVTPLDKDLPGFDLILESGERVNCHAIRDSSSDGAWNIEIHGLPCGYHRLCIHLNDQAHEIQILIHPRQAPGSEQERRLGVFLPIHAMRSDSDWGIGDFGDLKRQMEWSRRLGVDLYATLPFLAAYLDQPCEPSPYSPVSRFFWNEVFVDPTSIPEFHRSAKARHLANSGTIVSQLKELRLHAYVDYSKVMALKRLVLQECLRIFEDGDGFTSPSFRKFLESRPELTQYAAFRSLHEARGGEDWRKWPAHLRSGMLDPSEVPQEACRYHLYVQWLCEQQLAEIRKVSSEGGGLYLDLPLGVHAEGFDTWRFQDLFVEGVSLGAPPDQFFTAGQNWGLAPLDPHRLKTSGYKYFIEVIRHHCRQAGTLRLDHIMGLHRMFWIPKGAQARDGAYVTYPAEALYAILLIEASRTGTRLVGEDLGTVPPECRHMMHERGIRRMHVVQFGLDPWRDDPLIHPPDGAVTSLNTHDLPPWRAFIEGRDLDDASEMGLIQPEDVSRTKHERELVYGKLVETLRREGRLPTDFEGLDDNSARLEVLKALLLKLAEGASPLLMVTLEDLWLETAPQNVPGTNGDQKPNWRRKASKTLSQIIEDPFIGNLLQALSGIRSHSR